MEQHPLNQSSLGRARRDTLSAFNTFRFWVVELMSAPIIAWGMYLAIPNSASPFIKTIVPVAAFSIWMLAVIGGVFLLSLLIAPYKQRNEARCRIRELEEDRKPRIEVHAITGKPASYEQSKYTAWAELKVKNTSAVLLENVSVQIVELMEVYEKRDEQWAPTGIYHLNQPYLQWSPANVYWSERTTGANQFTIPISPNESQYALIAFHAEDSPDLGIFNTPTHPIMLESQITIEVSSTNSRTWREMFYIEYHPRSRDEFEFVEWDSWRKSHNVIEQPTPDKEGSQN